MFWKREENFNLKTRDPYKTKTLFAKTAAQIEENGSNTQLFAAR